MKWLLTLLISCIFGLQLWGQEPQSIRFEEFQEYVQENHPVMRQAKLLDDQARAYLQKARGNFDPKIYAELTQKSFGGKRYYQIGDAGIKWPVGFGLTVKSAYQWSNGIYLNPENNLPLAGQWNLGLELEALRGLLIDARRTALQQARIMQEANANEQEAIINQLMLEAGDQYWHWVYTWRAYAVYAETLANAEERLQMTRERFNQGDLGALDTVEAWIQQQSRKNDLLQAELERTEAQVALATFLWDDDLINLELASRLIPIDSDPELTTGLIESNPDLINQWIANHPIVQQYDYKLQNLAIDRRWTQEQLKPSLSLSYQVLGDGFDLSRSLPDGDLLSANAKWGIRFGVPLLLRKERANLRMVDQKIKMTEYDQQQKEGQLAGKINLYRQKALLEYQQWEQQNLLVERQEQLLASEMEKFRLGSSTLFLINSREQKLIETRLKVHKLRSQVGKSITGWKWATYTW